MAKNKTLADVPPADDIQPADGFAAEPVAETAPADEVAQLKARIAELEAAAKAEKPAGMAPGRYRVTLPDGPSAVVECDHLDHPFEVFKRVAGVLNSVNAPEIVRVKGDTPLGVVR